MTTAAPGPVSVTDWLLGHPDVWQCDTIAGWRFRCGGPLCKPITSAAVTSAIRERSGSNQSGRWRRQQIGIGSCATRTQSVVTGAVRIIGYSSGAGFVLTVIVDPADGAGITAWKSSGADLRAYEGGSDDG